MPIHPQLREELTGWLDERSSWPGAEVNPALFLNQRGGRLGVHGAHDVITGIAASAGLDDDSTAHVLRHSFATTLVRGGTDLVIVAELLGHAVWRPPASTHGPPPRIGPAPSICSPSTANVTFPARTFLPYCTFRAYVGCTPTCGAAG